MTDLSAFLPKILPHAPNCAEPMAFDAILQAATKLCTRCLLWRSEKLTCEADTNPIAVVAYDPSPDANELTLPAGAALHAVDAVYFDGVKLTSKDTAYLDARYPDWRTTTTTGSPAYVTQLAHDELQLYPSFEEGDVEAYLFLKPADGATELPDFLFTHYADEIANGALEILLLTPKQPFSDPNLGAYYAGKFKQDLDDLSSQRARGQQRAPLRTKAQLF